MSLTDLMPSTKDMLIAELQRQLTKTNTLLARGVHERDLDEAQPGTALWDARVHLGLDGRTGARDIRDDGTGGGNVGLGPVPVVLAVDPGVQVEQAAGPECPSSKRVDGLLHSWKFDGDDPRIECVYCGELRDTISGAVLRDGRRG